MMGGWSSRDFELLVRKVGDTQARAPCCRWARVTHVMQHAGSESTHPAQLVLQVM
jgi:hypothetical protein